MVSRCDGQWLGDEWKGHGGTEMAYGGRSPSLVGRDEERGVLRAFLDTATAAGSPGADAPDAAGEPQATLLLGTAGIGKTALWRAAVEHASSSGWRVLVAAPTEAERTLTFAGLGDLLAGAQPAELAGLDTPLRHALEVALLLRPTDGPGPDLRAVGLGLTALLERQAQDRPLLLAVDDAAWLDASSAVALAFAWRRLAALPVRALLTARRTDDLDPALAPLMRSAEQLRLGPLSLGATRELLGATSAVLTHGEVRRVHEIADGNPLHALELLRASTSGPRPSGADPLPGPAAFVPPRELADLVRSRLATLPSATRDLLLATAALSRPTVDDLAAWAGGTDPVDDISRAVEAGLLTMDGTRLRFAHPLYASACYRGASRTARRATHRRLAEVVADPEERARHLARGTDEPDEEVAGTLELAAQAARRRGSPDAAAELALLGIERSPDPDAPQVDRRVRAAVAYLVDAGSTARARALLQQRIARYDEHGGDRAQHVRNLVALARVEYEVGGPRESRAISERAVAAAGADPLLLAAAHLALASRSHCPAAERESLADEGLRLLDGRPDADPAVHAGLLLEKALATYHLGHGLPRDLLDRASRLEELASEPLPITWRARTCLGECLKYVDDFTGSEAILAETALLAEAQGDANALTVTLAHQSELALWLGRWDEADSCAERSARLAVEAEQPSRLSFPLICRTLVAAHRGQHEAARELGAAAVRAAREARTTWFELLALAAVGFAELSADRPEAAVAALAQVDAEMSTGLITAPRQWRYLVDYVEALVLTGDLELAADRLAVLERWAESVSAYAPEGWPALMAARARGLLLERLGDRDGALASIERAAAIGETLPLPFVRARTRLALASALRRARSKQRARELLAQAVSDFDALGATWWAERARRESARISGRAPAGQVLTVTEARVAALVAAGRSNREVARELVVTPRAVEAHLTRIYAKLGVRSRAELARHSVGISVLPGQVGGS